MAATSVSLPHHPLLSDRRLICYSSATASNIRIATVPQLQRCRTTTTPKLDYKQVILQKARNSLQSTRNWGLNARNGMVMDDYGDDIDDDDDDEEEEEEDRSLDLLIRFVENVFKKVSRKARKAVKSVLPVPISGKLVGFAVNGTIILTFLWVLKAFLEVICTLGSVVFASILLIRGIWTGISYFQESHNYRLDDDDHRPWTGSQPAF